MYDKILDAATRVFSGSGDRIAVTRTLAPALWAGLVAFVLDVTGVDVVDWLADLDGDGGLGHDSVQTYAPLILFAALYLVGKFAPGIFERLLLLVKVDATVYEKDATYLRAKERIPTVEVARVGPPLAAPETADPHALLDAIEARANHPAEGDRWDRSYDPDPLVRNGEIDPADILDDGDDQ